MSDETTFIKIKELLKSNECEDIELGMSWLSSLIGDTAAKFNYMVMLFYADMEDDNHILIDDDNYFKMIFKTFPIRFGKDYMYSVQFKVRFRGEDIIDSYNEYSRYRVGDGQPKFDFGIKICRVFKNMGIEIQKELFK